jgi:hypothetical protein
MYLSIPPEYRRRKFSRDFHAKNDLIGSGAVGHCAAGAAHALPGAQCGF